MQRLEAVQILALKLGELPWGQLSKPHPASLLQVSCMTKSTFTAQSVLMLLFLLVLSFKVASQVERRDERCRSARLSHAMNKAKQKKRAMKQVYAADR